MALRRACDNRAQAHQQSQDTQGPEKTIAAEGPSLDVPNGFCAQYAHALFHSSPQHLAGEVQIHPIQVCVRQVADVHLLHLRGA